MGLAKGSIKVYTFAIDGNRASRVGVISPCYLLKITTMYTYFFDIY